MTEHELTFPKLSAGAYGVNLEGFETDLRIVRDDPTTRPPGRAASWDVVLVRQPGSWEAPLFPAGGLDDAKRILRTLVEQLR